MPEAGGMLFFHAVLRIIPTFFNIPTPKAEGGGDEQWGNHGTLFCVVSDSVLAFNDVDSVEYFLTVIMGSIKGVSLALTLDWTDSFCWIGDLMYNLWGDKVEHPGKIWK
eukprot:scaffold370151_cov113-Cyclotella_meneghiniana.AAC.2